MTERIKTGSGGLDEVLLSDDPELARRHLASIVESSDDAIVSKDLNGVIQSWNAGALRIFGYTAEEVIGKPILLLLPEDRKGEETEILRQICRGERVDHFETVRRRKDGTLIDVSLTISPIKNDQGRVVGASKIARDITDRKRAQAELDVLLKREHRARAEAERASRLKDEFLATLSHELRNPLNVVIGYAEILRRRSKSSDPDFVLRAAETIRRNALAQSRLVSDLLDLSRLEMGKLSLDKQPAAFSTIIADAIDTVRDEAAAKNLSIEVKIESEVVVVEGDPLRLAQIAWNLLNNAVKFTPASGQIKISLGRDGDEARLAIEDTGQGIAPEFLPHLFEIFRQEDASSSRRHGGMGIGLALVKQLAELHGGRVYAESKGVGQGATFMVWIPLYTAGALTFVSDKSSTTEVLKSKTLLVVDDSRETIEMLRKLLTLEGAHVESASSGMEALQLLQRTNFDLVITDISMPEMDGYQLLGELRTIPSARDVPVLAVTGYGRSSDIDRSQAAGFADHLTKPLNVDVFLKTVCRLTEEVAP